MDPEIDNRGIWCVDEQHMNGGYQSFVVPFAELCQGTVLREQVAEEAARVFGDNVRMIVSFREKPVVR